MRTISLATITKVPLLLCVALSLCVVGCLCGGEDLPAVTVPKSRTQAISDVVDVLSFSTYETKDASIKDGRLFWSTQIHDPEMRWEKREFNLGYAPGLRMGGPKKLSKGWRVELGSDEAEVAFDTESRADALRLLGGLIYLVKNAPSKS